MNDLSEAKSLLNAANRDLRAMSAMTDSQVFADDFAVRLRYAELDNNLEPLEREQSIAKVQAIYQHVDNFISGQVSS